MKKFSILIPLGLKQSAITIAGNIVTTFLSALALIIMTRLLGPEKFGEFSIGFSLVLIIAKINDFGLGATVLKYASEATDKKTQEYIFSLTISYKLVAGFFIVVSGLIFSPLIARILNFDRLDIIWLAFLVSFATVFFEQMLVMLQSLHRFSHAVIANGIQAGVKIIGAIAFLLFNVKSSLVLFGWYALAPGLVWIFAKVLLPRGIKIKLVWDKSSQIAHQILGMTKHTSVNLIAGGIIENIDVLFVQRYLDTHETGVFGGVNRIAMLFALVAYSLANVLNPRAARYKTRADLQKYLMKSFLVVLGSGLLFLAFIPFSQLSILITVGREYLDGNPALLILVAAQCLAIASIPFISLFYTYKANWYFSVSGLLQLAVVIIGNVLLIPQLGLVGAAWTRLLTRLILFIFTFGLGLYIFNRDYVKHHQ